MNEISTGAKIEGSAASSQSDRETMRSLIDKGVEYLMPLYVDVHGIAKTKTVPVSHFDRMMRGSELFTGAALDGLGQGPHDDELAVLPDPRAVMQLPWRPNVAVIPGQLTYHEQPYPMCSRTVLAKQIERAAKLGLKFNIGIECETYIVRRDPSAHNGIAPNDARDTIAKAAYDASLTLLNLELLNDIVSSMNKLGWEVHSFDHEDANGQFEVNFTYGDALSSADRLVLVKMAASEIAKSMGMIATFMPKPFSDRTGTGAHFHISIGNSKVKNLFHDAKDKNGLGLSTMAYHFMGGVLSHAKALTAVVAPTINSYKRLVVGRALSGATWAPAYIAYGNNNRTACVRVPYGRLELRLPDGSANPYLASAAILAAGMDGVDRKLDPGKPVNENLYEWSPEKLKRAGIGLLPQSLKEALDEFEKDKVLRAAIGEDLSQEFLTLKRMEWVEYSRHVSEWERERYVEFF